MILRGGFTCQVVEISPVKMWKNLSCSQIAFLSFLAYSNVGRQSTVIVFVTLVLNLETCSELWFSVLWLFFGSTNKSAAKLLVMIRQEC